MGLNKINLKLNFENIFKNEKLEMSNSVITTEDIISGWIDEPYMNILMFQCDELRYVIEKLENFVENEKIICQAYVIGLLKSKLNNALLNKYSIDEYLEGISNLCQYYHTYKKTEKNDIIIKKSWMSLENRMKFNKLSILYVSIHAPV